MYQTLMNLTLILPTITMAIMYSWVFLLICPALFLAHGSSATMTPPKTSQDAFFLTACKEKVLISNVDVTDQVQVYSHMIDIVDVDFDPVNEKIYFTDVSGNNIYTVDPDGSNYEILLQESDISFIDLDYKLGYLYFVKETPDDYRLQRVNLRDVNGGIDTIKHSISNTDFITYLIDDGTTYESGIMLFDGPNNLVVAHDLNAGYCSETEINRPIQDMAINFEDNGFFYTISPATSVTEIYKYQLVNDVTSGNKLPDTGMKFQASSLNYYDDHLYATFLPFTSGFDSTLGQLGRYSLEASMWQFLNPEMGQARHQGCQNGHIHNPLDGVETYNQEPGRKSAVVKTRKEWLGGFIADISFNIGSDELTRIELIFPRQVYTLEIVGCDLHQRRKRQIMETGQGKGTKFTLVPNPDSTIEAGKDGKIRFSVIGKVWRNIRGFKAPIIADVYYKGPPELSYAFNFGDLAEDQYRCHP